MGKQGVKKIRSSFCTNVIPKTEIVDSIEFLAGLGYDGLEFWDNFLTSIDVKWLANYMSGNKIQCSQICPYFDFTGGKESWDKSIMTAEKYVALAIELGKPLIRVFTGKNSANIASHDQWDAAVNGLKIICRMGLFDNIRFALETHGETLLNTSDSIIRLLEEVGMENLGINLQVPLDGEDIWESVEKIGRYVIHLHAHNWLYPPQSDEAKVLGEKNLTFLDSGILDFEEFLRRLVEKGFAGYISIEHATHGGTHSWKETAKHEIAFLKRLVNSYN